MPHRVLNGAELWVEERGSGPETILFLHGLLWSGEMYRFQLEALAPRYRCLALDFRGQGRSGVPPSGYDMETLTDDAFALLAAAGITRCHVVGLSMGGFVGMRMALRRPDLVASLTLIETAADPEPRANIPKYRVMSVVARLGGMRFLVGPVMKIMFGRAFLDDPARAGLRAEMERRLVDNHRTGAVRALGGVITRRPIEDEIAAIRCPTLVLHGEDDRAIALPRARRMAERIPGARLELLPRAGHTSTIEEPAAVNRLLSEFLAANPA